MSFVRNLTDSSIAQLQMGERDHVLTDADFQARGRYVKLDVRYNATLFDLLKDDVIKGDVFPAIRDNELHFYYKGGCLFKFVQGAYWRDDNYNLYSEGTAGLPYYEKAKKQNENKYTNKKGGTTERQLLDKLYRYTYNPNLESKVVVLDIEVNLKGNIGWGKKCDLVLFNTESAEIMFVEGKVYSDKRVRRAEGYLPEVVEQVNVYTQALIEQHENIVEQYKRFVSTVNGLFGVTYSLPQRLLEPAKLLVYKTGGGMAKNVSHTVDVINAKLGASNVMWVKDGEPSLNEIWDALSTQNIR